MCAKSLEDYLDVGNTFKNLEKYHKKLNYDKNIKFSVEKINEETYFYV